MGWEVENQVHFEILQVATTQKLQRFTVNRCVVICGYSAVSVKSNKKWCKHWNLVRYLYTYSISSLLLFFVQIISIQLLSHKCSHKRLATWSTNLSPLTPPPYSLFPILGGSCCSSIQKRLWVNNKKWPFLIFSGQ